jgi:xylulokinase
VRGDPQHEGLLLSLDVGTSGVKASVFTVDGVCHGERSAPVNILTPRPGWSELDLEQVWEAVVKTTRDLVTSREAGRRVVGIGLSVASPTVVAVDSTGRALSNGLTYADSRAQVRLDRIRKLVGDERYRQLTGNRLALSLCSAAAMLHLADEASGPGGLRTGHLNSYLACRLTGRWVMDWTNASYTGLVNLRTPGEWSPEACEALEFPTGLLPELVAPSEPIGQLSADTAAELGLGRSVVVVAGAADTACSAYGVGCVNDGEVFESAGTSGVLTVCHARPLASPLFLNRAHVVPGRWLSHGAMSGVGAAVRWLRDEIFSGVGSGSNELDDYAWINAEAARSVVGAGGVVFLPYLLGERTPVWDPHARGAWIGMSVGTGRHDLVRAVLESAGYGMRQMLEIEEIQRGSEVGEVLIVGGGARNRFWTQIKADITGKRYRKAGEVESASRGAAMLAAIGMGAHDDVWAASAAIGLPEFEPVEPTTDPAVREIYERRYRVFKSLYPALRELFCDLRDGVREGATEPHDRHDGMKASTSKTRIVTWSVGAGGPGKQA